MEIVIGLDFGTRFSKVAYRIEGIAQAQLVVPPGSEPSSAFFETLLFVGIDKRVVYRRRPQPDGSSVAPLPFIKLLLKDPSQTAQFLSPKLQMTIVAESLPSLCAFFLSGLLQTAMDCIERQERSRLRGNQPVYSLNISIPAQYCDDSASELFRRVAGVALYWAKKGIGLAESAKIGDLEKQFAGDEAEALSTAVVGVAPEVIAALHQFLTRPDTPLQVHGFLDIGAGTIDACIFRLRRAGTKRKINILSAQVAPLGSSVLVSRVSLPADQAEQARIEGMVIAARDLPTELEGKLSRPEFELMNFLGSLLDKARHKMRGHILVHEPADGMSNEGRDRALDKSFDILIAGGGARSAWYTTIFHDLYRKRQLRNWGIMKYRLAVAGAPPGFPSPVPYERFLIAFGLTETIENLEDLTARLPSQTGPGDPLPRRSPGPVDYSDTKDALT